MRARSDAADTNTCTCSSTGQDDSTITLPCQRVCVCVWGHDQLEMPAAGWHCKCLSRVKNKAAAWQQLLLVFHRLAHLGCQGAAAGHLLLQQLHSWLQLQLSLAVWHGAPQWQVLQLEGMQQSRGHAAPAHCMPTGSCTQHDTGSRFVRDTCVRGCCEACTAGLFLPETYQVAPAAVRSPNRRHSRAVR